MPGGPSRTGGKSKVERLIQTIQRDFELNLRLDGGAVLSLSELTTSFSRWVATIYHLRVHSSTGQSPHQRFTGGTHPLRQIEQRALFSRISAASTLTPLPPEDIAAYLNWHISRAGLKRDIFAPAAIDLLAQASDGNPRTLGLLARAAWLRAARQNTLTIEPEHIHATLHQVPAASAKILPACGRSPRHSSTPSMP